MKNTVFLIVLSLLSLISIGQPNIEWARCYGGSSADGNYSVQQTSDGGYITAGISTSIDGDVIGNHGDWDHWVLKLDSIGNIQWQKSLGGSGNDGISSMLWQTFDNGFVLAGHTSSNDGDVLGNHGYSDFWVVKLDTSGSIEWQKCLGGTNQEGANAIDETNDSGYVVVGISNSNDGDVSGNHGNGDVWFVKLSNAGSIQWQKCFGGSSKDEGASVKQTMDGGYILAGITESNDGDVLGNHGGKDYWLLKISPLGILQWQKCFGGSDDDLAISVIQTLDGGYVMDGYSYSNDGDAIGNHGFVDGFIIKVDSLGILQWNKCIGGTTGDGLYGIQQTVDSGLVVCGFAASNDGDVSGGHGMADCWIAKLNSIGALQWQKCLGGTSADGIFGIGLTNDGGYVVSGGVNSNDGDIVGNHGQNDYWVAKLSPDSTTAISESDLPRITISVTPNPTPGKFTIQNIGLEIDDIIIYNLLGEKVMITKLQPEIDISNLPAGAYIVQIGKKPLRGKIIKE